MSKNREIGQYDFGILSAAVAFIFALLLVPLALENGGVAGNLNGQSAAIVMILATLAIPVLPALTLITSISVAARYPSPLRQIIIASMVLGTIILLPCLWSLGKACAGQIAG